MAHAETASAEIVSGIATFGAYRNAASIIHGIAAIIPTARVENADRF